jgi:hypothetical protein
MNKNCLIIIFQNKYALHAYEKKLVNILLLIANLKWLNYRMFIIFCTFLIQIKKLF